ncbi:MAG: AAA family ATPase [bacterium]|nr:AAA family ATPase [bacterium]
MQNNGVVLSAQRILFLSDFQSIAKPKKTAEDLKISQQKEKSSKKPEELQFLQNEFSVIVKNLISDNLYNSFLYRQKSLNQSQQKQNISPPKSTNLDQTIEIWNFLISHRRLGLSEDGTNLEVEVETGIKPYPASDLSDGEKVILYFISQVIQAPKNGFIVIDEPEMYLHKTILNKLWDILESHRQDCVFIYLTHDLEFAVSRTAKKVWVKEFKFPEFWEIEVIEENEIPESLLLELLGSRKNILFCEGDEESRDFRIYSQLFPWLTVMHVGGCFEVINYTKAFNKLQNVSTRALGIIDSDHRDPAQLKSLAKKHVFALSVAEVENLLLDEDFLAFFLVKNQISADRLQILKSAVITDLQKKQEIQISNYVSTKIDFYFKSTHPKKGNDLNGVKDNFQSFTSKIDIEKWYDERKVFLDEIISKKDYDKAITIFNNKDGLIQLVESKLKVSNFVDKCITLLQSDKKSHPPLHKHFPKDILQLR